MMTPKQKKIGPFDRNRVVNGDAVKLVKELPNKSIDIVITSPPYWGQRESLGIGCEEDPRVFLGNLAEIFKEILPKLKCKGIVWINLGDAYNTPINWRRQDYNYSTLGADKNGLSPNNSAYTKPRAKRKAFTDKKTGWLRYGNLLGLAYRLIIELCENGYLFRGEVIWKKKNPMPEGRCRRPHRHHESIYLLAKNEDHHFSTKPPIKSVWEFANEKIDGKNHFSRFPEDLPLGCINAYGITGEEVVVLDPFSGSGTTGIAAIKLGCTYIGFEIDQEQVTASNDRLIYIENNYLPLFNNNAVAIPKLKNE
jgi:DNA modification methylase